MWKLVLVRRANVTLLGGVIEGPLLAFECLNITRHPNDV